MKSGASVKWIAGSGISYARSTVPGTTFERFTSERHQSMLLGSASGWNPVICSRIVGDRQPRAVCQISQSVFGGNNAGYLPVPWLSQVMTCAFLFL